MLFLADFSPIKPDFGLLFWSLLFFLVFWFGIGKFAFKAIANALKQRSQDIQDSLEQAKKAREEMSQLVAENEQLLAQAREERALILKEAKEVKDQIIAEAREKARSEAQVIINNAKDAIENLKNESIVDVKNQAGMMALELAEKIMRQKLVSDQEQKAYVETLLNEYKLN
jgi:F-type H+-transporting ATPase subunit b